jgi:hypothetical protein
VKVLALLIRGVDTGPDPRDLVPVSLGHLMQPYLDNRILLEILHQVTPFSLWHLALLTIGMATIAGLTRIMSLVVVGSIWLLGAAILAGLVALVPGA